jgi:DNA-binding winged helix-turn-helix (wHTH) protein/tetratricopeptide (TPR) repeat protein
MPMVDFSRRFTFGALAFDAESGELTRNGFKVRVPDQAARILTTLLEHSGTVVTREELRRTLWPSGEFLDYDHSINNSISQLRDALRDNSRTPRFIETIPKRGYRFLAEVKTPQGVTETRPASSVAELPGSTTEPVISEATKSVSAVSPATVTLPELTAEHNSRWRMWTLVSIAAVVVFTVSVFGFRSKRGPIQPKETYIGIAPLEASGPDAEQLAESFRLDLTDGVSQLPGVQVRAAHSFPKGGPPYDAAIPALAQTLQIDTLLFGKFTVQGDECLIQFELVRGKDAIHLASLQYRGGKAELAGIRDKAQRDIFTRLNLGSKTDHPGHGYTENPRAYESYLRARYHLSQWTDESVARSLDEFESASHDDPSFAKAYAGKASAYFVLAQHEALPKKESFRKSRELAEKAIALEPSLAEAHAMLGQIALNQDWDFLLAEKELRQAVDLEPNQAIYHLWFSVLLCVQGKFDDSLHQIDLAHAADSFWPPVYMTEIFLAGAAHQYPRSIASGKKLITLMPEWPLAYDQLGDTLWYAGQHAEAIDSWRKMATLEKDGKRENLEDRGLEAFRRGGVPAYAQVRIQAAKSGIHWPHAENDFDLAEWYAYAGMREQALQALEAKVARHDPAALQIAISPPFDAFHHDPRFLALLARVGLRVPQTYPKLVLSASLQ